ncbi:MAG TPA: YkgJ family cysteine cluster protein [Nitrospirota bacterium]|nr:YkgJ family cysteine cluster protein [Nitrospirota bacterium]
MRVLCKVRSLERTNVVDLHRERNNEEMERMKCRIGCGACCIAPSLSSEIPGMPQGKQAGIRCIQLTADNICKIYGMAERPNVCVSYEATEEFCGKNRSDALRLLRELELSTSRSVERHDAKR